jgi:hypothetical protein
VGRELVLYDATPEELMSTVLSDVEPSVKVTLPVGVPVPEVGLTVAVSVTVEPWRTVVDELAKLTLVGLSVVPVPSRAAVTDAPFVASELTASAAFLPPAADGVNVTAIVQ